MSKLKAFTLIELLTVMGIIALMTGLGVYGLVRFQANTKVQTSFNDIFSLLKTIQNSARNSVSFVDASAVNPNICSSNGSCVPDYFGITFQSNTYQVYGCLNSGANIVCPPENQISTPPIVLTDVGLAYTAQQCTFILFQRLTGDILDVGAGPSWTPSSNTICNLRISNSYGDSKIIEINLTTNSIRDAGI